MRTNLHRSVIRPSGFTLIELMITVAVIGILAAVAYPSYTDYIVRANRSAAQSFMYQVANKQEQIILDSRAYAADMAATNLTTPAELTGKYDFATARNLPASAPSYIITGTPLGSQAARDTKCGVLRLYSSGVKEENGTAADYRDCW